MVEGGGLQRSTLLEIYENHAEFGLRNYLSYIVSRKNPGRSSGTTLILGFRSFDSRLEFSYVITKVTVCKDPLCRK